MKMLQQARAQLAESAAAMGPLTLVRAAEEHGGPHSALVLGPDAAGRRRALRHGLPQHRGRPVPAHARRAGRLAFLEPQTVSAHVEPAEVGPAALARRAARAPRRRLRAHAGRRLRDRARHVPQSRDRPARRWRSSRCRGCTTSRACGCSSTASARATRSRRTACARRSRCSSATRPRRRSPTPSSRSRRRPRRRVCSRSSPTSPTSTATPTRTSTRSPRSATVAPALLDFDDGLEVVRLTMAAYLSAEQGRVVDLTDPATRDALETYVPLIQQGRGRRGPVAVGRAQARESAA